MNDRPKPHSTPHDSYFKVTFSDPGEATALLKECLPAPIAARIDWSSLRLEEGSSADRALAWLHTDLLLSALMGEHTAEVYFVLEHQSDGNFIMAARCGIYVSRVLYRDLTKRQHPRNVPCVIPIVVSHGRPWNDPTELIDLYTADETEREALGPYLLNVRYILDDLSAQSEEDLRNRPLSANAKVTLLALRASRTTRLFAVHLIRWVDLLRAIHLAHNGPELLGRLVHYVMNVADDTAEDLRDLLHSNIGKEASEVAMTTAERLRQEGWNKGRDSGLKEGRDSGLKEGLSRSLLKHLTVQFGPEAAVAARERVVTASADDLERWNDRLFTAATLDDVFA